MKNQKYVHYCWFGGKKLPQLAKKCIASWQKFLPEYKIKRWSEDNCNMDECPFVKQMYAAKKWAFVADYFRVKALYEFGGIYLDTDMEIKKDISKLLKDKTFLGIEDTGYVAVGVWHERNAKAELPTIMLNYYQKIKKVDMDNLGKYSIPRIISECLKKYGVKKNCNEIQKLKAGIVIYPREYFYPLSYGHDNNLFTKNTCMIHYYDASWVNNKEKLELYLVRKIGRDNTLKIECLYNKGKGSAIRVGKVLFFPLAIYRRYRRRMQEKPPDYDERIRTTITNIKNFRKKDIAFYNKNWLGTASSTQELFQNTVDCGELFHRKDIVAIKNAILQSKIPTVTFSAFANGWGKLVLELKKANPEIQIRVLWHGSNSQILDRYGWNMNQEIIKLYRGKKIDTIASCKKSLAEYYNHVGLDTCFLTNSVHAKRPKQRSKNHQKEVRIGFYAARGSDWRKNMFSQIAAVGQIKNAIIDMVPLDPIAQDFAQKIGVRAEGSDRHLPRQELIERMSQNSVNLYVTFSECAPMLPLESMAAGVPCLTGNNHHYFQGSELEELLIINNECDVKEISTKIKNAVENRDKIIKLYQDFARKNQKNLQVEMDKFLEIKK